MADTTGTTANPFTGPDPSPFLGPDGGDPPAPPPQAGPVMAGLRSAVPGLQGMVGNTEDYLGRAATTAGAGNLGAWLSQQAAQNQQASQAAMNPTNSLAPDAGTAGRAAYGIAQGVGQVGIIGGGGAAAGAATGAAIGAAFGGVGAIPGAIAGGVLGWTIANVGAFPALMAGSQAGQTADAVAKAQLAAGASQDQANSAALAAGGETGAVAGLSGAALGLLGPLGKVISKAPIGSVVETALNATAADMAASTGKAALEGAAVNTGMTAANQEIEQHYGVGDGITAGGLIDSALVGAGQTGILHGAAEVKGNISAKNNFGVLSDPTADLNDRQQAAAAAVAAIATRNPDLAQDFGQYAAVQIAKGLPVELAPDHVYQAVAQQQRDAADAYAKGQNPNQPTNNTFTPGTGDQTFGAAPTDNSRTTGGADLSMQGQNINRPMPSDPNGLRHAIVADMPSIGGDPQFDPNNIPGSVDALNQANAVDDNFLDKALVAAQQSLGGDAARMAQELQQSAAFTGVPTADVSENTPLTPATAAPEQQFYADTADQAQQQMRQQAFDQNEQLNAPPATPDDAFTQRQLALAQQADQLHEQAARQGVYDQATNPDAIAAQDATATAAGAGEPAAQTPMSMAMNAELNRLAQRNPQNLTTTQLGTLAQHHPDPAVQDAAQQVLNTRKNRALVQDVNQNPENVSTVQQGGVMTGNEPVQTASAALEPRADEQGVQFSPNREQGAPATPLEPGQVAQGSPEPQQARPVAPEVAALKASLDQNARARGFDAAQHVEPVTRDQLPDEQQPANNGVEGATTLSKSDFDSMQQQAAIFGKKVQLFRSDGARPGEALDGAVLSHDPNTIYVNADASGASHNVVMGHELAHQMQVDAPDLYDGLSKSIMDQAQSGALENFAKYYGDPRDLSDPGVRKQVTDEFVSDLVGNRFPEMNTWRQVFAGADKTNPSLVYRIANFVKGFIDKVMASTGFRKFATDDMVNNLNEVRAQVRRALADYANDRGASAMQHEADQIRAAKANRDAGATPASKLVEPVKAEPRADVGKPVSTAAPAPVEPSEPEPTQGTQRMEASGTPRNQVVQESPERAAPTEAKEPAASTEPEHPYAGMDEDQYIQKINPDGEEPEPQQPVHAADIQDMKPENAEPLYRDAMTTPDGDRVQFSKADDGSIHAQVDGREAGFIAPKEGGSDLTVAQEYQHQGIEQRLTELYRRDNPVEPTGPLSPEREATERAAFSSVKDRLDDTAKAREAEGNNTANAFSSDPEIRKSGQRASYLGTLDAAQEAAVRNVSGALDPRKTIKQAMQEMGKDLGKRMRMGIADQFDPIKSLDDKAYMLSRLSKAGSSGPLEAALMYGAPVIRDGVYDVDVHGKGFAKIMAQLGGEHNRFFLWEAAQRAEQLKAEGRENLFTDSDISALKTLDQGDAANPDRAAKFAAVQKEYHDFNEAMLKIGRDSGILSDDDYQLFRDQPYVPFYRAMGDDTMSGPGKKSGLVNQYAYKKLKGGTNRLNDDLLGNVLQNYGHILDASSKNRAAQATMDAAEKIGVAHEVPGGGKGTVAVRVGGKQVHYEIDDPHLLAAVSAMSATTPGWMKPLSTFKRLLTFGTTVSPMFKLRTLIRDSIQSIATGKLSYNPVANIKQGIEGTTHHSQTFASMLASGGIIRMGSMMDGNDPAAVHRLIMKGVDPSTILNKSNTDKLFNTAKQVWSAYQELGEKAENVNRAALYQQLVKQGVGHAEASFQARDLMDFSMQGNWPVVRFLAQSVPFMNARIQGMYKLGRSAVENPARVAAVVGSTMMASVALAAMYQDDPDWKNREDWDRDSYWWFKIGQTAYRIPKPFEVGAAASLAERSYDLVANREETLGRYGSQIAGLIGQQLSMNPTPQIVRPLLDVYANKDGFTGRPIENEQMQGMQAPDRYDAQTSMTARFLGSLGLPDPAQLVQGRYSALSPVQMDSLLHGYFGSLGTMALGVTDALTRPALGQPASPAWTLKDYTGGLATSLPTQQGSRYITQMYDNLNQINQAYNSYHAMLKTGNFAGAQEERADNQGELQMHSMATAASEAMARMGLQEKRILNSTTLTSDEKRDQLDALTNRKNALAQRIATAEFNRQQGAQ